MNMNKTGGERGTGRGKPGGLGRLRPPRVLAIAALLILYAAQAGAQQPLCDNATDIAKQLSAKYEEAPVSFGLQSNGNLFQVWTSQDGSTWTAVSTTPGGRSCIVAAGKYWESRHDPIKEPLA